LLLEAFDDARLLRPATALCNFTKKDKREDVPCLLQALMLCVLPIEKMS